VAVANKMVLVVVEPVALAQTVALVRILLLEVQAHHLLLAARL
jgi:hypothetical protein